MGKIKRRFRQDFQITVYPEDSLYDKFSVNPGLKVLWSVLVNKGLMAPESVKIRKEEKAGIEKKKQALFSNRRGKKCRILCMDWDDKDHQPSLKLLRKVLKGYEFAHVPSYTIGKSRTIIPIRPLSLKYYKQTIKDFYKQLCKRMDDKPPLDPKSFSGKQRWFFGRCQKGHFPPFFQTGKILELSPTKTGESTQQKSTTGGRYQTKRDALYPLACAILEGNGYRPSGNDYKHPDSQSGMAGLKWMDDTWYNHSGSDKNFDEGPVSTTDVIEHFAKIKFADMMKLAEALNPGLVCGFGKLK